MIICIINTNRNTCEDKHSNYAKQRLRNKAKEIWEWLTSWNPNNVWVLETNLIHISGFILFMWNNPDMTKIWWFMFLHCILVDLTFLIIVEWEFLRAGFLPGLYTRLPRASESFHSIIYCRGGTKRISYYFALRNNLELNSLLTFWHKVVSPGPGCIYRLSLSEPRANRGSDRPQAAWGSVIFPKNTSTCYRRIDPRTNCSAPWAVFPMVKHTGRGNSRIFLTYIICNRCLGTVDLAVGMDTWKRWAGAALTTPELQ